MIATVTAPVVVSGAVFLLPVQLSVLGVPSPVGVQVDVRHLVRMRVRQV